MHVNSVLTAPQLSWEVAALLSVHRWFWKAPLQWNKSNLSLASMARACCLTISEESSYSADVPSKNSTAVPFEPRGKAQGLFHRLVDVEQLRSSRLRATDFTLIYGRFDARPAKIGQPMKFLVSHHCSHCPSSPHLQTAHSAVIDGPLDTGLFSRPSVRFTGLWATWWMRTNALMTQAGRGNYGVDVSELQCMAEGAQQQLNHLIRPWWLHLAGISPVTRPERPHQTWWLTAE